MTINSLYYLLQVCVIIVKYLLWFGFIFQSFKAVHFMYVYTSTGEIYFNTPKK